MEGKACLMLEFPDLFLILIDKGEKHFNYVWTIVNLRNWSITFIFILQSGQEIKVPLNCKCIVTLLHRIHFIN